MWLQPKFSNQVTVKCENILTTTAVVLHALNDNYISEGDLSPEEYYYKHSRKSKENDNGFINPHMSGKRANFPSPSLGHGTEIPCVPAPLKWIVAAQGIRTIAQWVPILIQSSEKVRKTVTIL